MKNPILSLLLAPLRRFAGSARCILALAALFLFGGFSTALAGPGPTATTNPATNITATGATLNGTVNANGSSTAVTFNYGPTNTYGFSITASPGTVSGSSNTAVSAALSGLQPGATYHYQVVAGTTLGADQSFTVNAGVNYDFENNNNSSFNGATSVTIAGKIWTLTGDLSVGYTGPGYGAPAAGTSTPDSSVYAQTPFNTTPEGLVDMGGFKAPTGYTFRAASFDVWPSADKGGSVYGGGNAQVGTVGLKYGLVGFKSGVAVVGSVASPVVITDTLRTPADADPGNQGGWWHHIDLTGTAFATTDIDEIDFVNVAQTGTNMNYIALDNFTFFNLAAPAKVYYITQATGTPGTGDSLWVANSDGTNPTKLQDNNLIQNPNALALDLANHRAFVADSFGGQQKIYTIDLNGTAPVIPVLFYTMGLAPVSGLAMGGPNDMQVDSVNGYLYYITTGGSGGTAASGDSLWRIKLDGTGNTLLFDASSIANASTLALDLPNQRVFVADSFAGQNKIYTVDLSGSFPATPVLFLTIGTAPVGGGPLGGPTSMRVDSAHNYLYYTTTGGSGSTAASGDTLWRVNLDGTGNISVSDSVCANPNALALDIPNNRAVVADSFASQQALYSVNLTTGAVTSFISGINLTTHNGIAFAGPTVTTNAPTLVTSSGATLNGTANAQNNSGVNVSFDYGTTTAYGSNVAATPSSVSGSTDTAVSAILTGLGAGPYHFRVNAGGVVGLDQTFTTTASAPTVTSISPTSGSTAGGTSVVITGTNFTGATAVKFGATNATSYTVNTATQITATSPAGASTVDVTVTTTGGTSATGAADKYTYVTVTGTGTTTHTGPAPANHMRQGGTGTVTFSLLNNGPIATSDPDQTVAHAMTVTGTLPAGLTLGTLPTGSPWNCVANTSTQFTCTNMNAIAQGSSYQPLVIPVNVASNAPASVTVSGVTFSGAGMTAGTFSSDTITIDPSPILSISKTHSGTFTQGSTAIWTLQVSNNSATASGATDGSTVTVTDTLPAGWTIQSVVAGSG